MFVALSIFTIANTMTTQVKAAFGTRPHLVDSAPSFLRMDELSPIATPNDIRLITYWTDETSNTLWHRSHAYHASHEGISKGLKLIPGSAHIRVFDHVAS